MLIHVHLLSQMVSTILEDQPFQRQPSMKPALTRMALLLQPLLEVQHHILLPGHPVEREHLRTI